MELKQQTFLLIIFSMAFISTMWPFGSLFPTLISNEASATEVTLAWDANTESNLAGYKLYYENENDDDFYGGTSANEGDSPITIYLSRLTEQDSPTYTISGLETGTYYYFALTAFDSDGIESDFSEEVGVLTEGADSGGNGCFISDVLKNHGTDFPIAIFDLILVLGVSCLVGYLELRPSKLDEYMGDE